LRNHVREQNREQPVAAAPINSDPLTLRVPVNEPKSDRLLSDGE